MLNVSHTKCLFDATVAVFCDDGDDRSAEKLEKTTTELSLTKVISVLTPGRQFQDRRSQYHLELQSQFHHCILLV